MELYFSFLRNFFSYSFLEKSNLIFDLDFPHKVFKLNVDGFTKVPTCITGFWFLFILFCVQTCPSCCSGVIKAPIVIIFQGRTIHKFLFLLKEQQTKNRYKDFQKKPSLIIIRNFYKIIVHHLLNTIQATYLVHLKYMQPNWQAFGTRYKTSYDSTNRIDLKMKNRSNYHSFRHQCKNISSYNLSNLHSQYTELSAKVDDYNSWMPKFTPKNAKEMLVTLVFDSRHINTMCTESGITLNNCVQKKVHYICSRCDGKVWGKPGLTIFCGDCDTVFLSM